MGYCKKSEFAREVASMFAAIFKVCNIKSVLLQLHENCLKSFPTSNNIHYYGLPVLC